MTAAAVSSHSADELRGSGAENHEHNPLSFHTTIEVSPQDATSVRTLLLHNLAAVRARFPNLHLDEEQLAQVLHASPLYQSTAVRAHCLGEKVAHLPCLSSTQSDTEEKLLKQNKERLIRFWSDTGIADDIQSAICRMKYDYFVRQNRWSAPETDETITALRCKAEMKHIEALSAITANIKLPLCSRRSQAKQEKFTENWEGIKFSCDVFELNDEDLPPMVKGRDIFNFIQELRDEAPSAASSSTSFRPLSFLTGKLPTLGDLRSIFYRLSPFYSHVCADDLYSWHAYIDESSCAFLTKRNAQAARILQLEDLERVRRHLQHGAVTEQRAELWAFSLDEQQVCGDSICGKHSKSRHYQALVEDVCRWELLLDHVMLRCIQTTVNNDLQYFIFEDIACQAMLLFIHDEQVASRLQVVTPLSLHKDWPHPARYCPPCGIIPFTEFAFYIMPITYVRSKVEQVYYTFRELYLNYFQFLHTINSHPHGLIAQCATFERILDAVAPDIKKHFADIHTDPLRFAYRWIMTAFSGFLPVPELLQLWDRMLGFDDMRLLAVTSVGIFLFKKARLMQAQNSNGVKKILKNLSDVRILDLLQEVLFNNEIDCKYEAWRLQE